MYDSNYAGFSEAQNSAEPRIQENTVQNKTQYNFAGIESQIGKSIEEATNEIPGIPSNTSPNSYDNPLMFPLGTSELANNKVPSWQLVFLNGKTNTTSTHLTGAHSTYKIPQADVVIEYKLSAQKEEIDYDYIAEIEAGKADGYDPSLGEMSFSDGSFINIEADYLLLAIDEKNSPFANDNFDIEVFIREDDNVQQRITSTTTREMLTPLSFVKRPTYIKDGILLDENEIEIVDPEITSEFVEHFLDILVDREIDPSIICAAQENDNIKNLFEINGVECPDDPATATSPYSGVTKEEGETC